MSVGEILAMSLDNTTISEGVTSDEVRDRARERDAARFRHDPRSGRTTRPESPHGEAPRHLGRLAL
jgi:hypothetical protein